MVGLENRNELYGNTANNSTVDEFLVNGDTLNDTEANDTQAKHKKAHRNQKEKRTSGKTTKHEMAANKANDKPANNNSIRLPSVAFVDDTTSSPTRGLSPANPSSGDHNRLEPSREAVIEEFKSQTKADATKLVDKHQMRMERGTKHLRIGLAMSYANSSSRNIRWSGQVCLATGYPGRSLSYRHPQSPARSR